MQNVPTSEKTSLIRLYEQRIGPSTPMISEALEQMLSQYPQGWPAEAIDEAITQYKQTHRHVSINSIAYILDRWKLEGRYKLAQPETYQAPAPIDKSKLCRIVIEGDI